MPAARARRPAALPLSRRAVLQGGLVAGAGLLIGFRLPLGAGPADAQASGVFAPNQWLKIDRDGVVTIVNSVPEMGQGSLTTMPMIVADELDVDLPRVKVEQAPANPKLYANPVTGSQSYGGSRGVRDHLAMLRKAGAAAREMLMEAAAKEWGVPVSEVTTEPGAAVHTPSGRKLPYGQLVDKAAQLPVPQNPKLKTPDQFRYIGKETRRRDTPGQGQRQRRLRDGRAGAGHADRLHRALPGLRRQGAELRRHRGQAGARREARGAGQQRHRGGGRRVLERAERAQGAQDRLRRRAPSPRSPAR